MDPRPSPLSQSQRSPAKHLGVRRDATRTHVTRRVFLRQSALATAAMAASSSQIAAPVNPGANERISIGFIGAGDRASAHLREILSLARKHNVAVTAVCDVWKRNRDAASAAVVRAGQPEPRSVTRYQDLLAFGDLDAVVIATPDFSHGTILTAALEAGKDVYIEKPMTIDVASANRAVDLAEAKRRVVQVGTQRRSDGHFLSAAKCLKGDAIGKINRVSASMHFNQARWMRRTDDCREPDVDWPAFTMGKIRRSFDARLLRCWQLFRETSNGMPGLWMPHYADAVHLLTGASYPASAVSLGGNYVWKDGREHADTFHALLEYPEGFLFDWSMSLGNSAGVHFTLHGTRGTLDAERWMCSNEGAADARPGNLTVTKIAPEGGSSHVANWLECLRSRAKPNADIMTGHQHVVATVMAAAALESGRRQKWDPVRREIVCA